MSSDREPGFEWGERTVLERGLGVMCPSRATTLVHYTLAYVKVLIKILNTRCCTRSALTLLFGF